MKNAAIASSLWDPLQHSRLGHTIPDSSQLVPSRVLELGRFCSMQDYFWAVLVLGLPVELTKYSQSCTAIWVSFHLSPIPSLLSCYSLKVVLTYSSLLFLISQVNNFLPPTSTHQFLAFAFWKIQIDTIAVTYVVFRNMDYIVAIILHHILLIGKQEKRKVGWFYKPGSGKSGIPVPFWIEYPCS